MALQIVLRHGKPDSPDSEAIVPDMDVLDTTLGLPLDHLDPAFDIGECSVGNTLDVLHSDSLDFQRIDVAGKIDLVVWLEARRTINSWKVMMVHSQNQKPAIVWLTSLSSPFRNKLELRGQLVLLWRPLRELWLTDGVSSY